MGPRALRYDGVESAPADRRTFLDRSTRRVCGGLTDHGSRLPCELETVIGVVTNGWR
jgi:hypothetical protein